MNEYYKKRYNISNYFLNIDTDDYYNIMRIILMLLIVNIVIYTIYPIIFIMTKKDINFTITIYIIFLIVFYIISYNLYISLKDICSNELLSQYYNYYKLLNIIFKENFYYFKKEFTDNLIKNINNIENVYDNKANELLNSSNDILKYYKDIENIYTQRLYFTFDKFKFLHKNLGFIDTKPNNDLNDENLDFDFDFENPNNDSMNTTRENISLNIEPDNEDSFDSQGSLHLSDLEENSNLNNSNNTTIEEVEAEPEESFGGKIKKKKK